MLWIIGGAALIYIVGQMLTGIAIGAAFLSFMKKKALIACAVSFVVGLVISMITLSSWSLLIPLGTFAYCLCTQMKI